MIFSGHTYKSNPRKDPQGSWLYTFMMCTVPQLGAWNQIASYSIKPNSKYPDQNIYLYPKYTDTEFINTKYSGKMSYMLVGYTTTVLYQEYGTYGEDLKPLWGLQTWMARCPQTMPGIFTILRIKPLPASQLLHKVVLKHPINDWLVIKSYLL